MIAKHIHLFYSSEEHMLRNQDGGIFIGRSERLGIPFMFRQDLLLNPHIFIVGVTGSGKSYMMKSLILKSIAISSTRVLIIDFTGEYSEVLFLSASSTDPADFMLGKEKIAYYNLSTLSEASKIERAEFILSRIIEGTRKRSTTASDNVLIFFDEAWKLLLKNDMLNILVREGRKYRVGVVIASQLIEDIESSILSNIASIFVFRTQNKKSLELLAKNYHLGEMEIAKIQELRQGSCMVIQIYKDKSMSSFFIDRVSGIGIAKMFNLLVGEDLIEVSETQIKRAFSKVGLDYAKFIGNLSNEIKVDELMQLLTENRLSDKEIIFFLRELGIDDDKIAEAFAIKLSGTHARR